MKQLKSSLADLRRLCSHAITVGDIAEPLVSFDQNQPSRVVMDFMEDREYDVVGVRENGLVTGYAVRSDLGDGLLGEHLRRFVEPDAILAEGEPLLRAFAALGDRQHVFVTIFGQIGGIVTRGDLQKTPVRLWLFGLVSLLEMQMLRAVRERFPGDGWVRLISSQRLDGARKLFAERRRRNEENQLSDCLQFADKASILMKDSELFFVCGFPSKRALETFFKEVGTLRNALAHANDIANGRWPAVVALVTNLEALLERLEEAGTGRRGGKSGEAVG